MAPAAGSTPPTRRRDAAWLVCLAVLALTPRLAYLAAFPARQFTDFQLQVQFAQAFNDRPFASGFPGWTMFGPGLPLALSVVLRLVPAPAAEAARYATAVLTGLTALLPFVLWRGVLGTTARVTAGLLLALWPGHILYSGVVSQDNWVLPPSIALAALAVRVLAGGGPGYPLAATVLFCVAGAVRPEMFAVLVPLLAAAAGLLRPPRQWPVRRLAVAAATLALGLLALGGLRWAGTGRFGLTPEHAGIGTLGSYMPGAGVWWGVPNTYFAAVAPELTESETEMRRAAWPLVWREMRRRPAFHAVRALASTALALFKTDADSLYWSIGFNGAVPDSMRPRAAAFSARVLRPLAWSTLVALSLCAGAVLAALWWRCRPILVLAAAMALKLAIHAVLAAQGRYFVVLMAFVLLVLALAAEEARRRPIAGTVAALAAGVVLVLAVRLAAQKAEAWVLGNEEQLTYRFTLRDPDRVARLDCVVGEGMVSLLWRQQAKAAIRLLHAEPRPGESVTADCTAQVSRPAQVEVRVGDAYLDGGLPGRLVQSVAVDGQVRRERDVAAEPGRDSAGVILGTLQPGERRRVVVRMTAARPDPGWRWGLVNGELWIETPDGR
jgi:hypothetical protein